MKMCMLHHPIYMKFKDRQTYLVIETSRVTMGGC